MNVAARVRGLVARHPVLYWAATAAVAATGAAAALSAVGSVEAARDRWGETRRVMVTAHPIAAGEPVIAEARGLPAAMVPADALVELPERGFARHGLAGGEVVVAGDVVAAGVAGLVPPDWVAVAVPDGHHDHIEVGDRVSLYDGASSVADGVVVELGADIVVVAVPSSTAHLVARAVLASSALVALRGA